MRVALVTMHTDPARGGAERYTADLARALAGGGHDVFLLAGALTAIPAGVGAVQIPARGLTRVGRYDRFLDELDAHLASTRYDVVHAMLPVRRCDVYHPHAGLSRAMVASDPARARLLNPRRARGAVVEAALLEAWNPPVVLCLSEYVRSAVRRWYTLPEAKLPILFNAVDLHAYDPARRPGTREATRSAIGVRPADFLAAFVGQDFERKGLSEAIQGLAAIAGHGAGPAPEARLLVVGRAASGRYRRLARRLGVEDRVIWYGHTDDAFAIYRAADVLVLPTRHDPCSLVVLEALATGLPVISTRFNGACEVMSDGTHGFVLDDPTDITALAAALRAVANGDARARMQRACLALRRGLAYEAHLRRLLDIYSQVIAFRA